MSDRVDAFLAGIGAKSAQMGRLIFALDATASREPTWDVAAQLQAEMFREAAAVGGLEVQLLFFRGLVGSNAECKASPWVADHGSMARLMARIRCETGYTQISRVLLHALRETSRNRIGALVYVGDAVEEDRDQLMPPAKQLGCLGVPVFMFQEGHDYIAQQRFQEIAEASGGAYHRFDQGSAKLLGELLRAVAAFAAGGLVALQRQDSDAARLLLRQIR